MANVILVFFATLFIGPIIFLLISRVYYKNENFIKYPVDAVDFIGDCMFLPFFNSLLAHYGVIDLIKVNSGYVWFSLIFAILVSSFWAIHRKNISNVNDWSRPGIGKFNFGGIYHLLFFVIQSFLIFIGILYLADVILVWFAVGGYLFTVIYHYSVEGPRTKIYKNQKGLERS